MRIAIVALLAIHGLIHAMGFAGAWGLAEFQGSSPVPTNLLKAQPHDGLVRILGTVWLLAMLAFLVAAVLLATNNASWRPTAAVAAAVSMVLVVLWWRDAPLGALANALVVTAVILAPRLGGVPA